MAPAATAHAAMSLMAKRFCMRESPTRLDVLAVRKKERGASSRCMAVRAPSASRTRMAASTASCSAIARRQTGALSKWPPSRSKSGPWRASQKVCTVSSSTTLSLACATAVWNARSPSSGDTPRSTSACIDSIESRMACRSRRLAWLAASAAISPSITRRARSSSSGPHSLAGTCAQCVLPLRASTYTPEPVRTSTQPSTSRAIRASRTEGRLTPSCLARSRSAGKRLPAVNSPLQMSERNCSAICRYRRLGSTVCRGTAGS